MATRRHSPRRSWARIAGLLVAALAVAGATAPAGTAASLSLSPRAGVTGRIVHLAGSGFPAGARINILFAGALARRATTNGRGELATRMRVPASRLGLRLVSARWAGGGAAARFRVRRCGPTAAYLIVCTPYLDTFSRDAGGLLDRDGAGTGFNHVAAGSSGHGFRPGLIDLARGALRLAATRGLAAGGANAQDNALSVGLRPDRISTISTLILRPPRARAGTGAQAGLWFGNDQDNYAKLVLRAGSGGREVQFLTEVNGRTVGATTRLLAGAIGALRLTLRVNPATKTIGALFRRRGGRLVSLGALTAPSEFFSADLAGIDPRVGTNSFAGVFASRGTATSPVTYAFGDFSVAARPLPPPPPGPITLSYTKVAVGGTIASPTAMAFGPDGRLYVTELMGKIHALTLSGHKVTSDQVIGVLGTRLALGLAVDPASTRSRVILWVAHSHPDLVGPDSTGSGGPPPNEGQIAKITVDPAARTAVRASPDPITGLPRSQSNHATNGLAFGPDGRLYIAQGGNTGAGAPNTSSASLGEFGLREEQPLSAAILVAAVKAAGFDGSCNNSPNIYAANPCSVKAYATGFRNAYDLVWHSNGNLYAPDNGASVFPTPPRSPSPPCAGTSPLSLVLPDQNDFLMRVLPGRYYGHPDPHRLPTPECVFKDGTAQGVAPLPNYTPPIADLGPKRSADGIIEYRGTAFGPALNHNLLITDYSQGDDIVRVLLSANGARVVRKDSVASGFNDPLPIVEGSDGTIYVGEFGGNKITALVPK